MYTALHRSAASVAECVGELCIAARCGARTSARILASVFSRSSNIPPYILRRSYYTMKSLGRHERILYTSRFVRDVEPDTSRRLWVDDGFKPPKRSLLRSQGS